ncbi:hypothetical protein MTP10_38745 [Nonomuraea sp. 3-1Str]|uniref:hypothetical protein n=1 Tax=Nonomuraea sp. 3-1Str TaxID=2929801 RepID=UPI0028663A5A|nr:hypothetical protein [Nonomuraea sp. 3-1Str]MDR8414653.1 hypothetical protein [Nonomuraea sp. 3-1Str]
MNELSDLARVRDEELAGRASGAGARALLASVTATDPADLLDPATVPGAGRGRLRTRPMVVGTLAAAALAAAIVIGPSFVDTGSGPATSYANSAIEIERRGGSWIAKVRDPFADHALYGEAFRAVGVDLDMELVPVTPDRVGEIVQFGGQDTNDKAIGGGAEPEGCTIGQEGCFMVVSVEEGFTGHGTLKFGRPARPGEVYQSHGPATRKGGMLAGVRVDERPVREVLAEVRRRGLKAVFQIIEPNPGGDGYGMNPARQSEKVGGDWIVWEAEAHQEGVVRLLVSEKRVAKNPVYGGPKPRQDTSE